MAPPLLFDLSPYDLSASLAGPTEIESAIPQRGHMRHLDRIIHIDDEIVLGCKDVRADEFWVEGHIPGRPLLPGVLMIESAAQVSAYYMRCQKKVSGFVGFLGCTDVKFRGQVVPGDEFLILSKVIKATSRRFTSKAQGLVDGRLVFEGTISGMPI